MRKGDRIAVWVFAVIGMLLAVGGGIFLIRENQLVAEASGWPSVEGRVDRAWVDTQRGSGRRNRVRYYPRVEYRYPVGGTTYANHYIWLTSSQSYSTYESAMDVVRAYPPGSAVQVFYNPADPRRSALRVQGQQSVFIFVIALGLVLLGVGWWLHRRAQAKTMHVGVPPQAGAPPG